MKADTERRRALRDKALVKDLAAGGETLAAFGSEIQRACAEAVVQHASVIDAAAKMGLEPAQLRAHIGEMRRHAARRGYSPAADMVKTTPEGFTVKGVSNYYRVGPNGERELTGQWVKTKSEDDDEMLALFAAMERIADAWKGKADPVEAPDYCDDDLMCVIPIGDPHLGMYAWAAETGHNFTLAQAEANLCAAVDRLVALAPRASIGVFLPLGDNLHIDNSFGMTTFGTRQDADTRWSKLFGVIIRAYRRCIDRMLEKFGRVIGRIEIGNHDYHASICLAHCLAQFYERDPRVEIDTSPNKFWHLRFGKVLIALTHTDTVKREDLPGVMACDWAKDWGETQHRYWYTGHLHHDILKEFPGCIVETMRTLAPKDKWHHDKGYRSGQDMKLDVIHREHGRINRHIVGIGQIWSEEES